MRIPLLSATPSVLPRRARRTRESRPPVKSLTNDPLWVGSRGHDACAREEGREKHGSRFHVRDVLGMKDINIRFPPSGRSTRQEASQFHSSPRKNFSHINITQGAKDGIDRRREGQCRAAPRHGATEGRCCLPALYQPGAVGWRRGGDTTERNGRGGCLTCLCVVRRLPPPPLFSHARQRNVGTRNSTGAPTPRQGQIQRSSDLVMEERGCTPLFICLW